MNAEMDVRHVLPAIRVPTLILHSAGDRALAVRGSRFMAEQIPGAKFVELPGVDHLPWGEDADAILDEIEEFLTGVRHGPEPDRVLATVLFTDIVGSTEKAAALGDRRWRDLLEGHHDLVRRELGRFRGREIDTTGDGFLATFDGPARAVRCARAIDRRRPRARARGPRRPPHRRGRAPGTTRSPGSPSTSAPASPPPPGRARSSCPAPSRTWSRAPASASRTAALQTLKGVPGEWHLFALEPEGRRA